jgi:hypothetical protein
MGPLRHVGLASARMDKPHRGVEKSLWLPPAGCEPIRVFSAFGAAALYRPEAFYRCAYESIDGDIEHSGLHRAMAKAGWEIYLNPAQRSLMLWLTEEQDAKGKHDDH